MPPYHLIGAWTRYSSWTARVQLVLEYHNLPYTSAFINLAHTRPPTPSGLVPALQTPHGLLTDSLAILEYLAETHPELHLWPVDKRMRALARCAAAEMHSGFSRLRGKCPSNYWGRYAVCEDPGALEDVRRVCEVWRGLRRECGEGEGDDGGWLCGEFGVVDAMFWPVLWRIRSYGLPVDEDVRAYVERVWSEPVVRRLERESFLVQLRDPETVEVEYENVYPGMQIFPEGFGSGLER